MEYQKREKLYKQMLENPDELIEINKMNIFHNINNNIHWAKLRIYDVTEFLNSFNSIFLFYVIKSKFNLQKLD